MVAPDELLALATEVARAAGTMLLDGLDQVRTDVQTKSTGTDMVSEMDRAAEALIVDRLLGARPDDGMVGEEGTDRAGTSGVRWVVDPLDGTTNYLYGLAGFGVSIAAELDGVPVAGVVLDVVRDELFAATRGGGATRDGMPITASAATDLGSALIATGLLVRGRAAGPSGRCPGPGPPRVRDIRRFGAAAVDLCSVACGRVDGYYEAGLAPWDLAAGGLIAAEAGAVLTDFVGGPVQAGAVVAAAPGIASAFLELVAGAGAADA